MEDVIEVEYGTVWCGGKVTSVDIIGLHGKVKEKHELAIDLELFKQREEKRNTTVSDFMFGAGGENKIRLTIHKK